MSRVMKRSNIVWQARGHMSAAVICKGALYLFAGGTARATASLRSDECPSAVP